MNFIFAYNDRANITSATTINMPVKQKQKGTDLRGHLKIKKTLT